MLLLACLSVAGGSKISLTKAEEASMLNTITPQQTTINSQNSELSSLVTKLSSQESKLISQQTELNSQQQTITQLENTVATLTTDLESQKNVISQLSNSISQPATDLVSKEYQSKITQLENTVATLTTDVADLRHIEHGLLDCRDSSYWTDGGAHSPGSHYSYSISSHKTASFRSSYKSPPVVFLSTSFRGIFKGNGVAYGTGLVNVTSTGFTLFCGGSDDSDYSITGMEVDWISFPA